MAKKYGLPYLGSKNRIAEQIVDFLPEADTLVDLFCGGCAITHCAMEKNKYSRYIINDVETLIVDLFVKAVNGDYRNEKRWISREDFHRLKDTDGYVKYCWSFSNKGKDYLYGRPLEKWKKALHYARVCGDTSLLEEMGINSDGSRADIKAHHDEYREKYAKWCGENIKTQRLQSLQSLESLESLERLQRLQSLQSLQSLERLESHSADYQSIHIPKNSIVYCDIPYNNTDCGAYNGFDHARFYEWALERDDIFISEYSMPAPFIEIWAREKAVLSGSKGTDGYAVEKIYTTPKAYKKYGSSRYQRVQLP